MDSWGFEWYRRGEADYEHARCQTCWNGRVPERYPDLIVLPESKQHVQEVVRYATSNGFSIGTKSGGHSWTASFLRDGGILVDLVRMNKISFDVSTRSAVAQPAAYGSDLNAQLAPHKLMFPAGHCPTVGLGGFLLQGGFGWNSRKWGLACESVTSIEIVTADGNLVHASSTQHQDIFWAARGAGCGFFGLVVEFTLKLWPLPHFMTSRYVFSLPDFDQVVVDLDAASNDFSLDLEVGLFTAHDQDGIPGTTLAITADALSDSDEIAYAALRLLHDLPVIKKAIKSDAFVSCTLPDMLKRFDDLLDNRGERYETNNMWTDTPPRTLLPDFHNIINNLPPAPSHFYLLWWNPKTERPDMAFSLEARLYVALYAIGKDPAVDAKHSSYVTESMERMEPYRSGIQLADENLPMHPGKFMAVQNFRILENLRKKYDPQGHFHTYMRLPPEYERGALL